MLFFHKQPQCPNVLLSDLPDEERIKIEKQIQEGKEQMERCHFELYYPELEKWHNKRSRKASYNIVCSLRN